MLRIVLVLLATLFVAGCGSSGGGGSSGINTGTGTDTNTDRPGSLGTPWTGPTEPPTNPIETAAWVGTRYDYLTLGGWSNADDDDTDAFGTFVQYDATTLSDTSAFPTLGTATFEGRHASYVQSSNDLPTQVNGDAVVVASFVSGTMSLAMDLYQDSTVFGEPTNRLYGLFSMITVSAPAAANISFFDEQVLLGTRSGAVTQATGGARLEGAFLGPNPSEIGLVYEAEHLDTTYRGAVGAKRTE